MKELINDDAFKPEKLFDGKNFRTIVIGREGFSKKENSAADLMNDLLDPSTGEQETLEILTKLRVLNETGVMVDTVQAAEHPEDLVTLLAACWESGLEFAGHLDVFAKLSCHKEFAVAVEAFTVVEECSTDATREQLENALKVVESHDLPSTAIRREIIKLLSERING